MTGTSTPGRKRIELLHDTMETRTYVQLKDLALDKNQENVHHEPAEYRRRPKKTTDCDVMNSTHITSHCTWKCGDANSDRCVTISAFYHRAVVLFFCHGLCACQWNEAKAKDHYNSVQNTSCRLVIATPFIIIIICCSRTMHILLLFLILLIFFVVSSRVFPSLACHAMWLPDWHVTTDSVLQCWTVEWHFFRFFILRVVRFIWLNNLQTAQKWLSATTFYIWSQDLDMGIR